MGKKNSKTGNAVKSLDNFANTFVKAINKARRANLNDPTVPFQLLPEDAEKIRHLRELVEQMLPKLPEREIFGDNFYFNVRPATVAEFEEEILNHEAAPSDFFNNIEEALSEAAAQKAADDAAWQAAVEELRPKTPKVIVAEEEAERLADYNAATDFFNSGDYANRNEWSTGLSGLIELSFILSYFPETREEGKKVNPLNADIFTYDREWAEYDRELSDDEDDDEEDKKEKIRLWSDMYNLLARRVYEYAAQLRLLGFEFPASLLEDGAKARAAYVENCRRAEEARIQRKAEEERAKAEKEAKAAQIWTENCANSDFRQALLQANDEQKIVLTNWGHKKVIPDWDYKRSNGLLAYVQEKIEQHRRWCKKNYQDFDLNLV